jgi:hypothetical protein
VNWQGLRRLVIFVLGVAVIVEGLVEHQDQIADLVIGLVMIGVLPLDDLLRAYGARPRLGRPSSSSTETETRPPKGQAPAD